MAIAAKSVDACPPVEVRRKLTPDDVWEMTVRDELDQDKGYELVDGELIELPPVGEEHGRRSLDLAGPLWRFARKRGGRAYDSSTGFMVGRDFQQLRSPDAAYVAPEH